LREFRRQSLSDAEIEIRRHRQGPLHPARIPAGDKYYDVIDALFQTQQKWAFARDPLPQLLAVAKQLGFTEQSFDECLANQKVLDGIDWVRQRGAEKFGVNSTPTFFINGTIHRGEMNLEETEKLLQPYLKA